MKVSVKTSLSPAEYSHLRIFLDANNMKSVEIDYYYRPFTFQSGGRTITAGTQTLLEYIIDETDESACQSLVFITIKYGSLESAVTDYISKIRNSIPAHPFLL